jgi:membrane associated rhomboid family serine protease
MSSPARRPSPGRPAPVRPDPAPEATRTAKAPRTAEASRTRTARRTGLRRLDPSSWGGAIVLMLALTAAVWVVQIVNAHDSYQLNRFGLRPREVSGLWGVLTMPFLHAGWHHLLSNTAPLVLIGWVVMIGGLRVWFVVTLTVVLVGGLLTWAVGPGDTVIVGASALVFGWLGYLIARAYFTRKIRWILSTALVLIFFGTLLYGLVPAPHSNVSWQAHACGLVAGAAAGAALHGRGGERRRSGRRAVSLRP